MTTQAQEEEARAALWREQQRQRVIDQAALWQAMAGDPAALVALRQAWEPVLAWMLERQQPDMPADEDLMVDPLGISNSVNVGT